MDAQAPSPRGPFLDVDEEGLAWLTFDDPGRPVNVLEQVVMEQLGAHIREVREKALEGGVAALVIKSGKTGTFIAGADLEAIEGVSDPAEGREGARMGQRLFLEIDRLPVPTLAVIDGVCVGGGLELSLACDYRIASSSGKTRLGLPEVMLGILPAWGGTTRLPRLIGLQASLDLILTGRLVSASRALRMGLVEELHDPRVLIDAARDFARARVVQGRIRTGARRGIGQWLLEETWPGRWIVLSQARKRVLKTTGGNYPAPLKVLDVVAKSAGAGLERALEIEADGAGDLIATSVSKHLIHVFHLREAARKGKGVEGIKSARRVKGMGVLGAGVMGGGIAQLAAYNGIHVRIKDIQEPPIETAIEHARSLFGKAVERRKLDAEQAEQRMGLIQGSLEYSGFKDLDLVVEAVVERMDVKKAVLGDVEGRVPEHCILATNTSSLSVDEMAADLARPERLVGMHFFNPVHRMPLVEIVRGPRTGDEAVAGVFSLALRLGKIPVITGDGPGFLVNRILGPYMNEAGHLLADGAGVESIDEAATRFGMPMGPLRLLDEVGIDVSGHVGRILHEALGDRLAPAAPLVALGKTDRLGRKGGLGFYRYENGKEAGVDHGVYQALGDSVPPERAEFPADAMVERLALVMINEAARLLDEGIVVSPGDVDLAMIMGTGFPPFRGGLLRYADELGISVVLSRLEALTEERGTRFAPSERIRQMVDSGQGFY